MGKARAILFVMLIAPVLLVSGGCANLRLPAIDPSGRRLFLPNPNYTTLARDGFLSRLHGGASGGLGRTLGGGIGNGGFGTGGLGNGPVQSAGPYQPALLNKHRGQLRQLFQQSGNGLRNLHGNLHAGTGRLLGGLHHNGGGLFKHGGGTNPLFGNSAYPSVGNPPPCGLNGLAPNGSPCYPMGSPSDSSLAMTLPGATNRIGSGLAGCNAGQSGMARFAQLGPGVVLAQPRYTARVGEEVVVLGGLQSSSGIVRGGEPVKWSLSNDSVGTIIDAASGAQPRRLLGFLHRASTRNASAAGCGSCVQSVTSENCRVLPRNRANPRDDIYLSKGQSWVSVTSGSPGRSFVTLAAPQLNCGRRVATAIIDWTDATWECPKPVLSSLEGPANLITRVFRNSDQQPLSNWLVRYTYIDGPKVTFNSGTDTADIPTDARGRAILEVNPTSTEPGTTRVAVQIYDPDLPTSPVSQCVGFVTWSESEPAGSTPLVYPEPPTTPQTPPATVGPPDFGNTPPPSEEPFVPPREEPEVPRQQAPRETRLAIDVKPIGANTATIGSKVRYEISVTNTGDVDAKNVQVWTRNPLNEVSGEQGGIRFQGSDVQPYTAEGQIAWDAGDIPPRRTKRFIAEYEALAPGEVRVVYSARATNTPEVRDVEVTPITGDVLRIQVSNPNPSDPMVGDRFSHGVQIDNRSGQPQYISLVVKDWTDGLRPIVAQGQEPPTPNKGIERTLRIAPGVSEWIPIKFEARSPGNQQFVVTSAVVNGNVVASSPISREGFVIVRAAQQPVRPNTNPGEADVRLDVNSPEVMSTGARERVIINLTNTGTANLTNIRVLYAGDGDLRPVDGTPGYRSGTQESREILEWKIDSMPPGYFQAIDVDVQASPNPAKRSGINQIRVIADQGEMEPKTIEIQFQQPATGPFGTRGGLRVRRTGLKTPTSPARRVGSFNRSDSALTATIETQPANVQPGEPFEFVVTVANKRRSGFRDVALCLNLPEDIEILDFQGPPMTDTKVSDCGRHLNFGTVREILPLEKLTFRAKAVSGSSGVAKTVARVEATGLIAPVIVSTDYQVR